AVEPVLTRWPEMAGSLSASSGPGHTILRVAGQIEGLPYRFAAHPSAYTVSFYGPGALSWLPGHWVSADRPGRGRFGGPRHITVGGRQPAGQAGASLAHPAAVPPNQQSAWALSPDEWGDEPIALGDIVGLRRTSPGRCLGQIRHGSAGYSASGHQHLGRD